MWAEEVAMFLTSNPHLLNRTEKPARRRAGIRPLRSRAPVNGINKTAEGRKQNVSSVEGSERRYKGMLYGWEWVIPEAQLQLIHSPPLTPLASLLLSLQNTSSVQLLSLTFPNTDLLIYICLTDLRHSHCWRIIWGVARSLICVGSSFTLHSSWTLLTPSSLLWASTSLHRTAGRVTSLRLPLWSLLGKKRVSHIREADNSQYPHSVKGRHKFSSARKSACGTVRRN